MSINIGFLNEYYTLDNFNNFDHMLKECENHNRVHLDLKETAGNEMINKRIESILNKIKNFNMDLNLTNYNKMRNKFDPSEKCIRNLFNNFGVTQYDFVNEWGPNNASGNPNANGSAYFNDWSTTTTTDDRIKLIISQKWVALATINFLEPWAEYRRTGYPDFIPLSKAPGALNHIPYRYMYPQREYDINNRNVPDGATNPNKVSTITTDSKIWWMP